jgi:anti-sigma factor RsiW
MNCEQARTLLLDDARGTLDPERARALREHLDSCAVCSNVAAQERVVSELLRTRLTPMAAPAALRNALAQQVASALTGEAGDAERAALPARAASELAFDELPRRKSASAAPGRRRAWLSMATAATVALGVSLYIARRDGSDQLLREARNDHLRVLYSEHPVEIPNGGIHQVKPWFSGRVDFAPDISFAGDDDFPMLGGAVGYFMDRKAANFIFKRRLHTISLFVFREQGLDWPDGATRQIGPVTAHVATLDGFNLLLWRERGLGHALVSDASTDELVKLCAKLNE